MGLDPHSTSEGWKLESGYRVTGGKVQAPGAPSGVGREGQIYFEGWILMADPNPNQVR